MSESTGLIVCGDRNWTDRSLLDATLDALQPVAFIIEGGCRGADRMSQEWAFGKGMYSYEHPADWKTHGKAAGPIRNAEMLDRLIRISREYDPPMPIKVVAFHKDIDHSKGTKDMIGQARLAGVPVEIYP